MNELEQINRIENQIKKLENNNLDITTQKKIKDLKDQTEKLKNEIEFKIKLQNLERDIKNLRENFF